MDNTKKNAMDNASKNVERTEFADELNTNNEAKNSKNSSNAINNK